MLTYPELMYQLETLYKYYDDMGLKEAEPTADALWVAIEIIQITERKDCRVTNLLKQLEAKNED